jgi:hypothetical protein
MRNLTSKGEITTRTGNQDHHDHQDQLAMKKKAKI